MNGSQRRHARSARGATAAERHADTGPRPDTGRHPDDADDADDADDVDAEGRRDADAVQERMARLLARVESLAHVGSWRMDLATRAVEGSAEILAILGVEPGVADVDRRSVGVDPGAVFIAAVHPGDRAAFDSLLDSALAGNLPGPAEFRIVRGDGSIRWLHAEAAHEQDAAGRLVALVGFVQDITEHKLADAALKEGSERLARAQRAAGAGLWDWDIASGHMDWSPELFALFGLDPRDSDATFASFNGVLHPDDLEGANAEIAAAVERRTPLSTEYRITRPDGETRWIRAQGSSTYDDAGRPLKMAGICIDVTERKRVEASLQESTRFVGQVIDGAREGVIVYGADRRYLVWNRFMERWSGVPASQVLGRLPHEAFPFLATAGVLDRVEQAMSGAIPEPIEFQFEVDGNRGWAIDACAPLRNEAGEVIGVIATVQDITAAKEAERTLRESEFLFKESQRAASIGSYRTDFTVGQWQSSEVLDNLFGIDATYDRSVAGWLDLVHPDDRPMMDRYLAEEVLAKQLPFSREYRIVRRSDGAVRWVNGLGEMTFDAEGNPLSMIGTIQDVTDRRRAEDERAELQAQLQQAQKMESVGRLAGGVAHDFNNMLGAILGYTELALESLDPADPLHADLDEVHRAAERSADLTRRLLAFARRSTVTPRVIDLNGTVAGMLKMLRRLIGEDIELTWRPAASVWPVLMDPAQLDQVLTNLCVNARDAIDRGGTITIESGTATLTEADCAGRPGFIPGDFSILIVDDDGCGMDADTLANLFEPFFTTKGVGQGTGLGLAVVYGIVKQNNGFIDVSSEPGVGTIFRIYLRRHGGTMDPVRREPRTAPLGGGRETILLVEDEPALLSMASAMLGRLGYTVLAAATPGEAIRLAELHAGEIDLLMTDVVMPEMNGWDLARRLMALYPGLKRLFMSGYTASIIPDGVLDEGVPFLQKPFSQQNLAAALRSALDWR